MGRQIENGIAQDRFSLKDIPLCSCGNIPAEGSQLCSYCQTAVDEELSDYDARVLSLAEPDMKYAESLAKIMRQP